MPLMVIAIGNQKGGIGKSTTAQAIGAGYAILRGYRVLMVDLDPQSNLTIATGVKRSNVKTTFDLLSKNIQADAQSVVQPIGKNLDIMPAKNKLSEISDHLPKIGRYDVLKKALKSVIGKYDLIILDTPPSLGDLTLNALMAADRVIVPAQADLFSLEAIKELGDTIWAVREYNKNLKIEGILLTRYQSRNILTRELTELIEETSKVLKTKVFKCAIREAVAIKEAQAMRQDIFTYAPKSKVAKDYQKCLEELGDIAKI